MPKPFKRYKEALVRVPVRIPESLHAELLALVELAQQNGRQVAAAVTRDQVPASLNAVALRALEDYLPTLRELAGDALEVARKD